MIRHGLGIPWGGVMFMKKPPSSGVMFMKTGGVMFMKNMAKIGVMFMKNHNQGKQQRFSTLAHTRMI